MRQTTGSKAGIVDTTKSMIIVDPNAFPVNLGKTATEDYPEGSFRLIAYDATNMLPTALGYKNFFANHEVLDTLALPSEFCQHVIIFQTAAYSNLVVALCEEGIYWCNATTDTSTAWQLVGDTGHNDAATTKVRYLWTYAMVANKLCCYCQGQPFYYIFADIATTRAQVASSALIEGSTVTALYESPALAFGINQVKPSFLNMAGQMGLFRGGARLGFWDSDNSVSWSSATYIQDFEPSVTTFAGNTKFADVVGIITKIVGQGSGFMIYSTRSITRCSPLSNSPEKWTGQAVFSDTGVVFDTQIAAAQPDDIHYALTSAGLVKITGATPEFVETEVSDYVQENSEVLSLKILDGRYLFLHSSDDLIPSNSSVEVVKVTDVDGEEYNFPPTIPGGDTPGGGGTPEPPTVVNIGFEDDTWSAPTEFPGVQFQGNPNAWVRSKTFVTKGEWGLEAVMAGSGGTVVILYFLYPDALSNAEKQEEYVFLIDYRCTLTDQGDQLIDPNTGPFITEPGVYTGTRQVTFIPEVQGTQGLIIAGGGVQNELASLAVDNLRMVRKDLMPPEGGGGEEPSPDPTIPLPQYINGQATGELNTLQDQFKDFESEEDVSPTTVPAGRTLLPCYSGRGFSSDWDEGITLVPQRGPGRVVPSLAVAGAAYVGMPLYVRFKAQGLVSDLGPTFSGPLENLFYDKAAQEWIDTFGEAMENLSNTAQAIDGLPVHAILGGPTDLDNYQPFVAQILPANYLPDPNWNLDGLDGTPWPLGYPGLEELKYSRPVGDLIIPGSIKMKVNGCSTMVYADIANYTMDATPTITEQTNVNMFCMNLCFLGGLTWSSGDGEPSEQWFVIPAPMKAGDPSLSIAVNFAMGDHPLMALEYSAWKAGGCEGMFRNLALLGLEWDSTNAQITPDALQTAFTFALLNEDYAPSRGIDWGSSLRWQRWKPSIRSLPASDAMSSELIAHWQFSVSVGFLLFKYPQYVAVHGRYTADQLRAKLRGLNPVTDVPGVPESVSEARKLWYQTRRLLLILMNEQSSLQENWKPFPGNITYTAPNSVKAVCTMGLYGQRPDQFGQFHPYGAELGSPSFPGGLPPTGYGATYWNDTVRPALFQALVQNLPGKGLRAINIWDVTVRRTDETSYERLMFNAEISGFGYIPYGGFSFRKTHSRSIGTSCPIPTGRPVLIAGPDNPYGLNPEPFVPTPGNIVLAPLKPTPSWPYPDPVPIPDAFALFRKGTPAPFYPLYKSAVFLDMLYQKWGRYTRDHRVTFDMLPVNRVDGSVIPQKDFGIRAGALRADKRLVFFTDSNNDSTITYGRLGYYRLGVSVLTKIILRFAKSATCYVIVETSYDGEEVSPEFTVGIEVVGRKQAEIPFTLKGKWFNIRIVGQFDLIGITYEGEARGRR